MTDDDAPQAARTSAGGRSRTGSHTGPEALVRRGPRAAVAGRTLPLRAEDAWALLTDMRHHVRWIPLTSINAPATLPVGAVFTATSGPFATRGAPGLADRMQVVRSDPPRTDEHGPGRAGVAVYRKLGPLLHGTAEIQVRPLGPATCAVRWVERVHLRGLPAVLTAPLLRPVLRAMVRWALRRVAAEVAAP